MISSPCQRTTLLINAGGKSRRMGRNKALLPLPPDDTPLIMHMLTRLKPLGFAHTLVVTNDPTLSAQLDCIEPISFTHDAYPDMGTLGGIATGLSHSSGWLLALACDMPLVNPALVAWLCELAVASGEQWDVIVPRVQGHLQTLHALYHPRALPAIELALANKQLRVADFLPQVRTHIVDETALCAIDPQLDSFIGANTPAEWEAVLA
jgi:molybdopterin-guanine dinucleotide biosynthesis protein A